MNRLAACYFCGTALDAPVESYPVVPASLAPTDAEQRTVTLCDGCREKLGTVVEHIVAAAEPDAEGDGVGLSAAGQAAEGGADVDADPVAEATGGVDPSAESDREPTEEREDTEATAAENGEEAVAPDEHAAADDSTAPAAEEGASDADEAGADEREGTETQSTGAAAAGVTPAAYNRVVRLLQNREFPVEVEEMRTLATNAYDLDPGEFDAIVEVLAEREPVRHEGGQLHRGE